MKIIQYIVSNCTAYQKRTNEYCMKFATQEIKSIQGVDQSNALSTFFRIPSPPTLVVKRMASVSCITVAHATGVSNRSHCKRHPNACQPWVRSAPDCRTKPLSTCITPAALLSLTFLQVSPLSGTMLSDQGLLGIFPSVDHYRILYTIYILHVY